jgi:CDP-diacylglycerol--serine O-phosphatidyltransferase
MKQLPNIFTLLNLFLGCMAITFLLQNGIVIVEDEASLLGQRLELAPEQLYLASLCIAFAAVVDFLDGFVARLFKASSDLGKQLDSLADVVSFGVAPGIIIYQFLRLAVAKQVGGLDASALWLWPAFVLPCAAAFRLARFNIDTGTPSYYFRGTPVPSVGITVAAVPLIWWQANTQWQIDLLTNKWALYAFTAMLSWLMVSNVPVMSNKPKEKSVKGMLPQLLVAATALVSALVLGWWAAPVTFAAFVVFSVIFKKLIV